MGADGEQELLQISDEATGRPISAMLGHPDRVPSAAVFAVAGAVRVATGGNDGPVGTPSDLPVRKLGQLISRVTSCRAAG